MSGWGNFVWENGYGGSPLWLEDPSVPYEGRPSLRSAPIGHSSSTSLATGLFDNTAGPISWVARVHSENSYDWLRMLVFTEAGAQVSTIAQISGNRQFWAEYSFAPNTLPAGRYRLVFRYTKDNTGIGGSDTAWIAPISGFPSLSRESASSPPLGAPGVLVAVVPRARIAAPPPLAVPGVVVAQPSTASVHVPFPLGAPALRADAPGRVVLVVPPPLHVPRSLVRVQVRAAVAVPPPLSAPGAQAATRRHGWGWTPAALGRPVAAASLPAFVSVAVSSPLGVPRGSARLARLSPAPAYAPAPGLLLSDPLPLRKGGDLPDYRADAVLPWVYGRVWISPVPLDAVGLLWLVADHPVTAIERVTVGGVAVDGWQLVQQVDATGQAVALLRLTRAPADGAAVAVRLLGRRHPVTGATIEHPADIAADVLRQCGWSVPPDAFQGLRDGYPELALGLVFAAAVPLRDAIAAVIEPLGAVWSADRLGAWPRRPGVPVATLDALAAERVGARAVADLATVARVAYAYDWAVGAARETLLLEAPEAIDQHGRIVVDIAVPAVRTARAAYEIGAARLADLARPRWQVEVVMAGADTPIEAGHTVTLAHPRIPMGDALVTSVARERARDMLDLTVWLPAGISPRIEIMQRGVMVDAERARPSAVVFRDGVATFTVTDDYGMPLAGAAVVLDGQELRNTDRGGRVQFTTSRGAHTLTVYMDGYAPFQIEVIV